MKKGYNIFCTWYEASCKKGYMRAMEYNEVEISAVRLAVAYWPGLVVNRQIDRYTAGQVSGRNIDRKIGPGLARTSAAVPVPLLLHYRGDTISTPLNTFSLIISHVRAG